MVSEHVKYGSVAPVKKPKKKKNGESDAAFRKRALAERRALAKVERENKARDAARKEKTDYSLRFLRRQVGKTLGAGRGAYAPKTTFQGVRPYPVRRGTPGAVRIRPAIRTVPGHARDKFHMREDKYYNPKELMEWEEVPARRRRSIL